MIGRLPVRSRLLLTKCRSVLERLLEQDTDLMQSIYPSGLLERRKSAGEMEICWRDGDLLERRRPAGEMAFDGCDALCPGGSVSSLYQRGCSLLLSSLQESSHPSLSFPPPDPTHTSAHLTPEAHLTLTLTLTPEAHLTDIKRTGGDEG